MFTRLAVEEIAPTYLVVLRLFLASVLLGPIFIRMKDLALMKEQIPAILLLGIINAALPFFLYRLRSSRAKCRYAVHIKRNFTSISL